MTFTVSHRQPFPLRHDPMAAPVSQPIRREQSIPTRVPTPSLRVCLLHWQCSPCRIVCCPTRFRQTESEAPIYCFPNLVCAPRASPRRSRRGPPPVLQCNPAPPPTPRCAHAMVLYGATIFVHGGEDGALQSLGGLALFDRSPGKEAWLPVRTPIGPCPAARSHHRACAWEGACLIGPGFNSSGLDAADTWLFDVEAVRWRRVAGTPPEGGKADISGIPWLPHAIACDGTVAAFYGGQRGFVGDAAAWLLDLSL